MNTENNHKRKDKYGEDTKFDKYKSKKEYIPSPDIQEELLIFPEEVQWISNDHDTASLACKFDWKKGPKKLEIDSEALFISGATLITLMRSKRAFDHLPFWDTNDALRRSNPYERFNSGNFFSRTALIMANIDSRLNNLFTSPKGDDNTGNFMEKNKLTFADICGGSGGFVDYVLWRKNNNATGYGITLNNNNGDYLRKFKDLENDCFKIHDGAGMDNDNMLEFAKFVLDNTHGEGVNFAMANGTHPISFDDFHYKDTVFQRLMMCQIVTGLLVIKEGGHFVTNMFDILTPFTASLVYILYLSFKSISILKPVTSRPANSLRYIICKSKIADTSIITNYLLDVNIEMESVYPGDTLSDSMIVELLPLDIILNDRKFVVFLTTSNEKIANVQIQFLKKWKLFADNKTLFDPRYKHLAAKCVAAWNLPEEHAIISSLN